MTEQQLIQRAKNGNQSAFGELIELHQSKIFTLTYRMTGNREDAQDLAQEAFLNAWRGLGQFKGDSSFSTWLYRLASNVCIDHIRKQKRRQELVDAQSLDDDTYGGLEIPDHRNNPHQELEQQEIQAHIEEALSQLQPEQREIILLREVSGLSYQEISTKLELDLGTVKSRISRARLALRKILLNHGNFFGRDTS